MLIDLLRVIVLGLFKVIVSYHLVYSSIVGNIIAYYLVIVIGLGISWLLLSSYLVLSLLFIVY